MKEVGLKRATGLYLVLPFSDLRLDRICLCFPVGTNGKDLPVNTGDIRDTGSIPRSGRFPRGGYSNPLYFSWLENPMDRGAGGLQSIGSHRVGQD